MHWRIPAFSVTFSLWVASLPAGIATAQPGSAEIIGQVLDAKGAGIPEAQALLTSLTTGSVLRATSGTDGLFTFPNLRPGIYALSIIAPGFRRLDREQIRLATGERLRLDAVLQIGAIEDTVVVDSTASPLAAGTPGLGQVISNRSILALPLNGRNFVPLVALTAGVALPPGSLLPRINGGRPRTNEYLFDGISVLQPEPGQVAFFPVIDAIQDFKVEVNSPPAEFGRFNGGLVNLTTRSGSNELHGTAFEFLRNEALNARNLFAPSGTDSEDRPRFRRNQFGFVLGGPLKRDNTFFFVDYQGTRQSIARVRISTVPTLLQRQGIFTESSGGAMPLIFDPATTRPGASGNFIRDPFEGNTIPESRMDPAGKLLIEMYPLPNSIGTTNNFSRMGNEELSQDQFDLRLDHRASPADSIFGRFSLARDLTDPVTPLPDGSGSITSGAIGRTDGTAYSIALDYSRFGPRWSQDLRVGHTRRSVKRRLVSRSDESIGIPGLPDMPRLGKRGDVLPTFEISGFQQLGVSTNANSDFHTDVTQIADTISIPRGRHYIKAGLDLRWERLDIWQPPSPAGVFQFTSLFTDLPGAKRTGHPLASLLLGQVQDFSIDFQGRVLRPRAHWQEYFVQDDWKVARSLSINIGLRYTLNFPSTERDDQGAVFNLATEKLEYLGRNGFPRSARELHRLNLGPRFGIAWGIRENTVIRAGYGLIWIEQAGITTPFTTPQFPFIQTASEHSLDAITPAFQLSTGPTVERIPLTEDAGLGQGVFSVDRPVGSGYAQQWNLAVQQQFTPNLVLEAAYAGSKITRVGIPDANLNQLTADQLKLGNALLETVANPYYGLIPPSSSLGGPTISRAQLLKPFPRFTTVSLFRNNTGNTNYHALHLKAERRFAGGLSFLVSYTRSKLLDDASSVFDAAILTGPVANYPVADSFNRRLERDVSNGDMPSALAVSGVYQLPFGTGRRFDADGWISWLIDDWELGAIVVVQSGLPLPVVQTTNFNAFAGFGTQRPNRIANPALPPDQRTTQRYFDTSAFQAAPQFTLGDSSRNPVRGPGYRSADVALIKRMPLRDYLRLEFRAEAFNLTNTPPLAAPNTTLGSPAFGTITSAGDPRVLQFGLKLSF